MSQDTKSLDALMKRLETPSPAFEAFRDSMPPNYWARYDLTAVRLGWEAAQTVLDASPERVEESADVRQVPVAWVLPGDDHERDGGWIDARINREGEFTKPLYAAPEPAVNEPEQTIPAWINEALDFEPSKQFGVADMANVGHALMQALPKGYVYSNSPAEIVTDLQNQIADLEAHKPQSVSDKPAEVIYGGFRLPDQEALQTALQELTAREKAESCCPQAHQPANKTPETYTGQEGREKDCEILSRQVSAWRKEIGRLEDLISTALSEKT